MSKRRNDMGQMRREEYDAAMENDDPAEAGVFKRASEDKIKARKIVTARRRVPVKAPTTLAPGAKTANPFPNFQGLTPSAGDSVNPFSGFSGLTAADTTTANTKPVANPFAGFSGLTSAETTSKDTKPSLASEWKELNDTFANWTKDQLVDNPELPWNEAVQEYLNYAQELVQNYPEDNNNASPLSLTNNIQPPSVAVAKQPLAPTPLASFLSSPTSNAAPAPAPAVSGFSFQSKPTPAAPAPAPAFSGFSFQSSSVSKPAPVEEEEEEQIGREEATIVIKDSSTKDETCVYELEKAKYLVFKPEEKSWGDKGVHPLKIMKNATTKSARLLMRNSIGKVVLNAAIYPQLQVQVSESAKTKKPTGVIMVLMLEGKPVKVLLRVREEFVLPLKQALEAQISSS